MAADWPADAEPRIAKHTQEIAAAQAAAEPRAKAAWRTHPEAPHSIVMVAGRVSCEACLRYAGAGTAKTYQSLFTRSACQGSLQDIARSRARQCRAARRATVPHLLTSSPRGLGPGYWC